MYASGVIGCSDFSLRRQQKHGGQRRVETGFSGTVGAIQDFIMEPLHDANIVFARLSL